VKAIPKGHTAVMANRVEAPNALDFFPTPPWATRALCELVLRFDPYTRGMRGPCWEPAAGEGHMAEVLREYFRDVHASDVHDYGCGYGIGTFIGEGPDRAYCAEKPDWIITNPPFNLGVEFAKRAIGQARRGVALLLRSVWMESRERYEALFRDTPPTVIAVFCERVPMTKGRWDPEASTATSYAWFVWWVEDGHLNPSTRLMWIPPGQRKALERPDDRRRFAAGAEV
jgi:hypothetical protein